MKYAIIFNHKSFGGHYGCIKKAPALKTTAKKKVVKASKATAKKSAPKKSTAKATKKVAKKSAKKK